MVVFIVCFCLCALDAVPEEPQEPEPTVADQEIDEPSYDLHCDEDLDDGKSTGILT
jgi:hypothetical protein